MDNITDREKPEQRKNARYARGLSVSLHEQSQGIVDCKSTVLNLSESGLCLETTIALVPGQHFSFDLFLPNGFPVAGMGECRWKRVAPGAALRQYGVKILAMDPVSERALMQYVVSLSDGNALSYLAASSRFEREQAFRLVHDSYVRMGYMEPNPSGIRFTSYHADPGTATFVASAAGAVVATMSVFLDGKNKLPIDQVFGREVAALRAAGRKVAEFGSLAHRRSGWRRGLDVFLNLCRLSHAYAYRNGVDDILITVNPRHRELYPKLLKFKAFGGGERTYEALADNPAMAYRLDLREATPKSEDWRWFIDHPVYAQALLQGIKPVSEEEAEYFMALTNGVKTPKG